jgi:hypothetical protein
MQVIVLEAPVDSQRQQFGQRRFGWLVSLIWLATGLHTSGEVAAAGYNPCTDFSEHFALNPAAARQVVVVGYFTRGRYLRDSEGIAPGPPPPRPDGLEDVCISLDPNPMRVQLQVTEVLHGELRAKRIWAVTTAHFGLQRIPFGRDKRVVAFINTDGERAWLPRYGYPQLQRTSTGGWMLPFQEAGDHRAWFPCGLDQYAEPVVFRPPYSGFKPEAEHVRYYRDKAQNNPHIEFKDGVVRWLSAVSVASVAKALVADPPRIEKSGCRR